MITLLVTCATILIFFVGGLWAIVGLHRNANQRQALFIAIYIVCMTTLAMYDQASNWKKLWTNIVFAIKSEIYAQNPVPDFFSINSNPVTALLKNHILVMVGIVLSEKILPFADLAITVLMGSNFFRGIMLLLSMMPKNYQTIGVVLFLLYQVVFVSSYQGRIMGLLALPLLILLITYVTLFGAFLGNCIGRLVFDPETVDTWTLLYIPACIPIIIVIYFVIFTVFVISRLIANCCRKRK